MLRLCCGRRGGSCLAPVKMGEAGWELCVFVGNMPDSRLSRKTMESGTAARFILYTYIILYRMSKILARFEDMTLVAFGRQTQQTNNSTSFLVLLPAWRFRILSKVTLMNHWIREVPLFPTSKKGVQFISFRHKEKSQCRMMIFFLPWRNFCVKASISFLTPG